MILFAGGKNKIRLSGCLKSCLTFVVVVLFFSLGGCKTLDNIPDEEKGSSQGVSDVMQPWVKKQPGLSQLFSTEESKSTADIVELINYFNRAHQMSSAVLKNEVKVAENAYKAEPLPITGLSLAYLYTVNLSLSTTKKSEKLLVALIKDDKAHENYRTFAQLLLHSVVAESSQRRLWIKERRKNKKLNQQLEALKNIELKINERQPASELVEPAS